MSRVPIVLHAFTGRIRLCKIYMNEPHSLFIAMDWTYQFILLPPLRQFSNKYSIRKANLSIDT